MIFVFFALMTIWSTAASGPFTWWETYQISLMNLLFAVSFLQWDVFGFS